MTATPAATPAPQPVRRAAMPAERDSSPAGQAAVTAVPDPTTAGRATALAAHGQASGVHEAAPVDWQKLYAARLLAARVRPYLASALFALHPVASARVPTMAVDRHWRCYVSAAFVASMPVEELAGVWVHEVSHLLRDHHTRGDRYAAQHPPPHRPSPGCGAAQSPPGRGVPEPASREHTCRGDRDGAGEQLRRNIAADLEINDDVYGDGLAVPSGAVLPASLRLPEGLLMEEYLGMFRLGPATGRWAWLDCGSGADGDEREWDLGPDGAHGLTAQERDAIRFRVAQGIAGARGSVPRGWQRWADRAFHPPQPWRDLLGAAVRSAASTGGAGDDYTYGRPARRAAALPGFVLPALRRTPPRVCVVIDTSGSVSDADLGSALLEVAAIGRAVGGGRGAVSVISCDAAAGVAHELCRAEGIPLIGGGGTDLRAGFVRALSGPRPDVIVALTDGLTPWPAGQPPCRTVVGLFPRRAEEHFPRPPEWARVVHVG